MLLNIASAEKMANSFKALTSNLHARCRMGIKRGTKLTDTPKDILYQIRVDSDTDSKVRDICKREGISKSEAVRQGIDLKYNMVVKGR